MSGKESISGGIQKRLGPGRDQRWRRAYQEPGTSSQGGYHAPNQVPSSLDASRRRPEETERIQPYRRRENQIRHHLAEHSTSLTYFEHSSGGRSRDGRNTRDHGFTSMYRGGSGHEGIVWLNGIGFAIALFFE